MFDLTEALSPFVARNGCAGQLQFGGENSTTFEERWVVRPYLYGNTARIVGT